jgi:DNA helicase IV
LVILSNEKDANFGVCKGDFNRLGASLSTEEQETISTLYARLDQMRVQAQRRLAEALARPSGGTHQARSERDSAVTMYADQIRQWDAAEHGLCFGRLDFDNGEVRHIGRLGLFDPENDYEPLLVDWRAPAARPFYLATAANPPLGARGPPSRTRCSI